MSTRDLIANWEEALATALGPPDDGDAEQLNDEALDRAADRRLRSDLCAGRFPATYACSYWGTCYESTCGRHCV